MQTYKVVIILVLLALVALFTFQNLTVVEIKFLFWSIPMPSAFLLLATLIVGILLGMLLSFLNFRRKAARVSSDTEQHVL
jgi:uncharacterized integral membrane protein